MWVHCQQGNGIWHLILARAAGLSLSAFNINHLLFPCVHLLSWWRIKIYIQINRATQFLSTQACPAAFPALEPGREFSTGRLHVLKQMSGQGRAGLLWVKLHRPGGHRKGTFVISHQARQSLGIYLHPPASI